MGEVRITDEMVDRAIKANIDAKLFGAGEPRDWVRAALEAALTGSALAGAEPVTWPEPSKPIKGVSFYDHIIAHGYRIEWKSWKDYPSYSVEREPRPENDFLGSFNTLDEAKRAAERDMAVAVPPASDLREENEYLQMVKDKSDAEVSLYMRDAEAEIERLRKALEPFVRYANSIAPERPDTGIVWGGGNVKTYLKGVEETREWPALDVGDFRRARAALSPALNSKLAPAGEGEANG